MKSYASEFYEGQVIRYLRWRLAMLLTQQGLMSDGDVRMTYDVTSQVNQTPMDDVIDVFYL